MIVKIKKIYLLAVSSLILMASASLAFALEVELPGLKKDPSLGEYAGYFFAFLIAIAGTVSLISFAVGAVGLINPNVEAHGDAKDRMKGAVLGLVLTIASFAIIKTINPNLFNTTIIPLTPILVPEAGVQPGVYFYATVGCTGEAMGPLTSDQGGMQQAYANGGLKSIKIVNDEPNGVFYGVILHNSDLDKGGECSLPIAKQDCQPISIKASSASIFKLNPNEGEAGNSIQFYGKPFGSATGAAAGVTEVADAEISDKEGITLDLSQRFELCLDYTGVNAEEYYKHKCSGSTCSNPRDFNCKKNDDCRQGEFCYNNQKTCYSGTGTCLSNSDCYAAEQCNTTTGWCYGKASCTANSDCASTMKESCDVHAVCKGQNQKFLCSQTACETFQDCPGSIRINGSYLVALYAKNPSNNTLYCQTFNDDVSNLKVESFLPSYIKKIEKIYIAPTQ